MNWFEVLSFASQHTHDSPPNARRRGDRATIKLTVWVRVAAMRAGLFALRSKQYF